MHDLPDGWHWRRIDEIGQVQIGRQLSPIQLAGSNMRPYLRVANVYDGRIDYSDVLEMNFTATEFEKFELHAGDILLNEGQSLELVGRSSIYDGPSGFCFQNTLLRFRPTLVNARFAQAVFKRWLDTGEFTKIAKRTTSIAHLGGSRFAGMTFPVPPLSEQRRIAEILDALDLATRSIRSSTAKFSQLRSAHIRELMGDGLSILRSAEASELSVMEAEVRGSWTVTPLGSVLDRIEAGNSPSVEDTPARPGEWGVLKVSAVGRNGFRPEENKVAHDKTLHAEDLCVRPGDLLISRANTSELVGLTCIVRETPPGLMLCDKTLRLHVNESCTSAEYIHLVLSLAEVRRQIETAATGTSGSMKNISQAAIRRLVIPWADKSLMGQVVRHDAGYTSQIESLRRKEQGLNRLKSGLMEDLLTGRVRVPQAEAVLENL